MNQLKMMVSILSFASYSSLVSANTDTTIAKKTSPQACEVTMRNAMFAEHLNICGPIEPSDEVYDDVVSFYLTYTTSENEEPQHFEEDAQCGIENVDDGLPTMQIIVKPLDEGACEVIEMNDMGV